MAILEFFQTLFQKESEAKQHPVQIMTDRELLDFIERHTRRHGNGDAVVIPMEELGALIPQKPVSEAAATEPNAVTAQESANPTAAAPEPVATTPEPTAAASEPTAAAEPEAPTTAEATPAPAADAPAAAATEVTAEPETPAAAAPAAEAAATAEVIRQLQTLQEAVTDSARKDSMLQSMHKELEEYKKNFYVQLKTPFAKSLIDVDRRMSDRLQRLEKDAAAEGADSKAMLAQAIKNMEFDRRTLLDVLEDEYDLEYFEPAAGDSFNPKEHSAVTTEATADAAQAGTIKQTVYGGYRRADGVTYLKAKVIAWKNA